jgi:hypothetical protein
MTIMMEREADLDTDDFTMEIDEDITDFDLTDLSDLMEDGCEEGEHLDAYTLETGSCTITQRCDSCGSTWTEDL